MKMVFKDPAWVPYFNSDSLAWHAELNVNLYWTPGWRNGFVDVYFQDFDCVPHEVWKVPQNWVIVNNGSGLPR